MLKTFAENIDVAGNLLHLAVFFYYRALRLEGITTNRQEQRSAMLPFGNGIKGRDESVGCRGVSPTQHDNHARVQLDHGTRKNGSNLRLNRLDSSEGDGPELGCELTPRYCCMRARKIPDINGAATYGQSSFSMFGSKKIT